MADKSREELEHLQKAFAHMMHISRADRAEIEVGLKQVKQQLPHEVIDALSAQFIRDYYQHHREFPQLPEFCIRHDTWIDANFPVGSNEKPAGDLVGDFMRKLTEQSGKHGTFFAKCERGENGKRESCEVLHLHAATRDDFIAGINGVIQDARDKIDAAAYLQTGRARR